VRVEAATGKGSEMDLGALKEPLQMIRDIASKMGEKPKP
jgi:hypothetical protein